LCAGTKRKEEIAAMHKSEGGESKTDQAQRLTGNSPAAFQHCISELPQQGNARIAVTEQTDTE